MTFPNRAHDRRPMPEAPGVEHRYVVLGEGGPREVCLHLAETGTGSPVLLVHGYLQHWYVWRQLLPLLGDSFRLICVDLRGFGWSEQTARGYDIDGLSEDLAALLVSLELPPTPIIGADIGGTVALRLAERRPSLVASVLALGVNHPAARRLELAANLWRMWFTALLEYPVMGRLMLRHVPAFTRFLLRYSVGTRTAWPSQDLEEFVQSSRVCARAGQQLLWQMVVREMPRMLRHRERPSLAVPALILGGERDPIVPARTLDSRDGDIPSVCTRVIPGYGHHLPVEAPQVVAAAARELFGRIAEQAPSVRHEEHGRGAVHTL